MGKVKVEKHQLEAELKLKMLNTQKVTFSISTLSSGGTFELFVWYFYESHDRCIEKSEWYFFDQGSIDGKSQSGKTPTGGRAEIENVKYAKSYIFNFNFVIRWHFWTFCLIFLWKPRSMYRKIWMILFRPRVHRWEKSKWKNTNWRQSWNWKC